MADLVLKRFTAQYPVVPVLQSVPCESDGRFFVSGLLPGPYQGLLDEMQQRPPHGVMTLCPRFKPWCDTLPAKGSL